MIKFIITKAQHQIQNLKWLKDRRAASIGDLTKVLVSLEDLPKNMLPFADQLPKSVQNNLMGIEGVGRRAIQN